jgi:hypothetical protein
MTGISCQRCHKPICGECMNPASVGFQCPCHGGAYDTTGSLFWKGPSFREDRIRYLSTSPAPGKNLVGLPGTVYAQYRRSSAGGAYGPKNPWQL